MVVLLNTLAGIYLSERQGNRGYALIDRKWELLTGLDESVDILIVGDSSCNQGLMPSIVSERLDATSLNLCTIGALLAVDDVWMLEYYLGKHDKLSAVILVHAYNVWQRPLSPVAVAQVPQPWGFWKRMRPSIDFEVPQLGKLFVARYLHLIAQNTTLKNALMYGWRRRESVSKFRPSGFMEYNIPRPQRVLRDSRNHVNFVSGNQFRMSAENRQALEQAALLADERNFQLYLAHSPMFAGLYENSELKRYIRDLNGELADFAAGHDRVHLLDPNPEVFAETEMESADHLVLDAARKFSAIVADKILQLESIRRRKTESHLP